MTNELLLWLSVPQDSSSNFGCVVVRWFENIFIEACVVESILNVQRGSEQFLKLVYDIARSSSGNYNLIGAENKWLQPLRLHHYSLHESQFERMLGEGPEEF
ncbi:hypothetical protein CEXT_675451 [Caerostris extrusa]|uniref:Uncharacterized protein n=1 Tax=Caerostris extrusa TaxID=172846 RepID=A0AAV4XBV2_CAEEX|nr:hypothetical protein CEXT_675451 [Caerostris extrusa]